MQQAWFITTQSCNEDLRRFLRFPDSPPPERKTLPIETCLPPQQKILNPIYLKWVPAVFSPLYYIL